MNLIDFIKNDYSKGLFPLKTNLFYTKHGEDKIREYVYNKIFNQKEHAYFLPMQRAYALKDKLHVRSSLQLDPVATFFLYDFVHRNIKSFQKKKNANRNYYGYAFIGTTPISSYNDYHIFRNEKYDLKRNNKYFAKLDIADCFNSFYHHDIVAFISEEVSSKESEYLGQFLREGNVGRSINCFPQGIYPAKTIGNGFLKFIEESQELQSTAIIRYLDDIFLFSSSINIIEQDIIKIQSLLGERGLCLNSEKTKIGSRLNDFDDRKLDKIQKSLVSKRQKARNYDDYEEDNIELSCEEKDYLITLIKSKNVTEEDTEMALSLINEDKGETGLLVDLVFTKYPNLIKNLYQYINNIDFQQIDEKGEIIYKIIDRLKKSFITEYELFWITRILIDFYTLNEDLASLLMKIYNHPSSTPIIKAAILEIESNDFGLFEIKENMIKSASNSIPVASAVAGIIKLPKSKRNQIYKYAGKGSPFMNLICSICSDI